MRRAAIIALLFLVAAGCGQKGPLYLRENPPPGMKAPRPEPYKPLPYPKESGEDEGNASDKK